MEIFIMLEPALFVISNSVISFHFYSIRKARTYSEQGNSTKRRWEGLSSTTAAKVE